MKPRHLQDKEIKVGHSIEMSEVAWWQKKCLAYVWNLVQIIKVGINGR
jgi:hypothetical protein